MFNILRTVAAFALFISIFSTVSTAHAGAHPYEMICKGMCYEEFRLDSIGRKQCWNACRIGSSGNQIADSQQPSFDTVLTCSGGQGGPGPATVILKATKELYSNYTISLLLRNGPHPGGIRGTYNVTPVLNGMRFSGAGSFTSRKAGSILLNYNIAASTYNLSIYSGGDNDIEYGYGVHFICK